MLKLLKDFKTWLVLICSTIVVLSQIPQTRDTAYAMVGIASAKKQEKTLEVLGDQAEFNKFVLEMVVKDTLLKRGMDSTAVKLMIDYLKAEWDSLLRERESRK